MTRGSKLLAGLVAVFGAFGGLALGAGADDAAWEDARGARLDARVAAMEAARRAESSPTLVAPDDPAAVDLEHGDARFVGEIARVDVTLDVTNRSGQTMEWARTVSIDPQAEVIGASLERANAAPISCRTLPLEDARRIYGEARGQRPTRPTPPGRDPLRLERETDDALQVVVFPIAARERVRIRIAFATPLRGSGEVRTYVDPIRGFAPAQSRPAQDDVALSAPMESVLIVRPGTFTFASASPDVVRAGGAADALRFFETSGATGPLAPTSEPSRISFAVPRGDGGAIAVRGGGLGTRIALWRFDPADFLREHGVEPRPELRLRLVGGTRMAQRIAPDTFEALAEPTAVSARLSPGHDAVRCVVEVFEGERRIASIPLDTPVERVARDEPLEDAVVAWHRARLARRALEWAGDNASRRAMAIVFAVDAGTLVPGTAALAVPENEQRWLPRTSRRQYERDGAELGGDADWASPPSEVR